MRINNAKVLIIKLSYIGDTVTLIPVINNLKEKAPDVVIDVMVNRGTEELLTYHPYIRNVYAYDRQLVKGSFFRSIPYYLKLLRILRLEKYDFVIDFTLGDRSAFISFATGTPTRISYQSATKLSHLLMNRFININPLEHHVVDFQLEALRFFGLQDFRRSYEIYFPDQIQAKVDRLLDQKGIAGRSFHIAIHPGARKKARQWRPERFGEIAYRLHAKYNAGIILLGGPEDHDIVDVVESRLGPGAALKFSDLSLLEMAALLKRCHLFIGNDTAPGHIAAGVQCPTLTLFGPNLPLLWRPISPHGDVVFKDLPCCRCRHEIELCIRPENNCMDMITVDEVWEKTEVLLAKICDSQKMRDASSGSLPFRRRRPVKIAVVIPRYGLVGGGEFFAQELTERIAELSSSYEIHVFANQWRQRSKLIHFHKVPIVSFPKYLTTASFAWFARRGINKIGFDIIHSHERIFDADIVSLHSTPHRLWVRDVRKKRFPSLFDRVTIQVEKCMVHNNDKALFLPVSSITRDWFVNEYPHVADRTQVMHPGVDMAKFERLDRRQCRKDIRARFDFLESDTLLLFVGMNFELKGLEPLILAIGRLELLSPKNPLKLLVVGKGNHSKYQKMAEDNGIGDDIRFAGVIEEKIEALFLASDFYAMLSSFDTFGMTVLEAMAASLPVIVTPQVGAKDLVQDGVNGFIVAREDIEAIGRKILLLLDDEKRAVMGGNAYRVAKWHSWDSMAHQIKGFYEDILNRKYR